MSSINNRNFPLSQIVRQTPAETADQVKNQAQTPGTRPLSKVEQQELAEHLEAPAPRKNSAAEMERMVAQTGFARTGRKRNGRGFDLEDNTQAPIPLPVDEVDESSWEQRTLDDAQEQLTLQSHELQHLAEDVANEGEGELGLFGRLIQRSFKPVQEGVEGLQKLANAAPPAQQPGMAQVASSIHSMFGIKMGDVPNGPAMVAAALVVAGMPDAVQPEGDSLEANRLSQGMQKLVENSSSAVEGARGMSSGINKQLAVHRTFMFKR